MFVDINYFTSGTLIIEGVAEGMIASSAVASAIRASLQRFINLYEREFLAKFLGKEYDAFVRYVEGKQTGNERYDKLRGELKAFAGVACLSPIANYVYFRYVGENSTTQTSLGVTVAESNNRVVSPENKQMSAWNAMVDMVRAIQHLSPNCANELLTKINVMGV